MAVMDDELLGSLLHEAGASFAVPDGGPAEILRRARPEVGEVTETGDPDSAQIRFDLGDVEASAPRPRRVRTVVRSHRLLAVAASVIVLAALTTIGLALGPTTPALKRSVASRVVPPSATSQHGLSAPKASSTPGASGSATGAPGFSALSPSKAQSSSGTAVTPSSTVPPPLPTGVVGQPAKIEQTGSLDLEVRKGSLSSVLSKLAFLAEASNGFVSNSQSQSGIPSGGPSGSVTLQVPVADFSTVLKQVQALGRSTQVTTKATDVTGQYVDLQSRITALEASRQQYLTIMSKATTVGDVLAVQAQLDSLQSQIEQLQGQLSVLTGETAYSTLTVLVSESAPSHQPPPPRPASGLSRAWHDSVHGFVAGVEGLIRVAGPALFVLLCLSVVVVGGRVAWRRVQRHNL
jgi:hypothetical protein